MKVESDPRLVRLDERIKQLEAQIQDLEWNGGKNRTKLTNLKGSLAYCKALLRSGQIYLPLF